MAESFLFVKARCFGSKHKGEKQTAMAERRNVEFAVEGGVTLRGWLFVPGAKGPAPAITMAHGYQSQFEKASGAAIAWFREHLDSSGDAHND
jgi:cephalosporin-C deacetylase-like acetyl esterase